METSELIHDWNLYPKGTKYPKKSVDLNDETLRDGLQSSSVRDPKLEAKIKLLHLMEELGINALNIGLPGAGERMKNDSLKLAQEIRDAKLKIVPNCAARTLTNDIIPVIEISQTVGIPIEVATFIGSSPIRVYAEEWNLDMILKRTEESVKMVVDRGLPCMYVTEDTTRAHPDTIKKLYQTAINFGAQRICICDTVGHITPTGVKNLILYIKKEVVKKEKVKIDWHGHSDRGLSLINALSAIEAGVNRVHATALGIGERVGNTPMDLLLVNLKLLGVKDEDLSKLPEYCQLVSRECEVPVPFNYPVMGRDAFRTATGVHAAAVIKAEKKGDTFLADRVYSGVPAGLFGRKQEIEIGPMSGVSNVIYCLTQHNIESNPKLVEHILKEAKEKDKLLTEEDILQLVRQYDSYRKNFS